MFFGLFAPAAQAASQAGAFLHQEPEARGAAMAGAMGAVSDGSSSLIWNPAGLGRLAKPELSATYVRLFEETNYNFFSAGLPTRWGAFSAGFVYQASPDFERRTGPNDTAVNFSITQTALLGGWGASLPLPAALRPPWVSHPRPLALGAAVKTVRESIDQTAGSGTGGDAGLILQPREEFSLAATWHNALAPRLRFVSEPVRYSRVLSLSPAFSWRLSSDWKSLLTARFYQVQDENWQMSGGAELQYGKLAAVRAGMQDKGLSTGLGLRLGNTQIDYAVLLHQLGLVHIISLTQRFGHTAEELEETIRRGITQLNRGQAVRLARAYYQKAEGELQQGRIGDALRDLEAAALLDPGNRSITDKIRQANTQWDQSLKKQMVERNMSLAREQAAQGRLLASLQYWRSVLELDGSHPEAMSQIAKLERALSQEERQRLDSMRKAQSAIDIKQALLPAQAHLSRNNFRLARSETERVRRIYPDNAELRDFEKDLNRRARDYVAESLKEADRLVNLKEHGQALKLLTAALREEPEHQGLSEKAAQIRALLSEQASPDRRKEIEQLYYRAVEQYLKGQYQNADKLVDQVLTLDPSSEAGAKLKEKVQAALKYNP
ncbi:MAG: hypothetical protein HY549_07625 [Elusimicrobia bacterium]|nr:hypothetical protein [Elusimicrobiota bacterium]